MNGGAALFLVRRGLAKDSLSDLQIRDVQNMLRTVPDLDFCYMEKWVAKLGLDEVYRKTNK